MFTPFLLYSLFIGLDIFAIMRLPLTLNIQTGRKLVDKTKDEIMSEVVKIFKHIRAVQICYDTIRVTFRGDEAFQLAKANSGVHIFGMWCNILGGGPPVTVVNLFDYPFEGEDDKIEDVLSDFGEIRRIRHQSYVSCSDVFTGTRLVSIVLKGGCTLPRYISIDGYHCRMWYRGQPLICNLCALQGHKSANCPNKDKCRRCGETGHFARACPNPWGSNPPTDASVAPPVVQGGAQPVGSDLATPALAAPVASVPSEPDVSGASSQQASNELAPGISCSDSHISEFSSQSQDLFSESSDVGSFSESQSILRNVDKCIDDVSNLVHEPKNEITVIEENVDDKANECESEITVIEGSVDDNNELGYEITLLEEGFDDNVTNHSVDNNENSITNNDSLENMDLSGPSKKRSRNENDSGPVSAEASTSQARKKSTHAPAPAGGDADGHRPAPSGARPGLSSPQVRGVLGRFLPKRGPPPAPNVAKASQRASVGKASQKAVHSSLPVVAKTRSKTKP